MADNRNPENTFLERSRSIFEETFSLIYNSLGERALRPERAINAAFFDSFSVAVAQLILSDTPPTEKSVSRAYEILLKNEKFRDAIGSSTSGEESVKDRFALAAEAIQNASS
ncbi:MAG: hypothetical protein JJ868_14100 [Shimia sp.]|uniref:hypothetical protein n=1 Tax=Shimia sp. TaxID=1954381 RepID=UPI001B12BC5C|nr:hypothetical protein [Shimia sp.]MBO6898500.1 hypothetical protein [Shimia sp.]